MDVANTPFDFRTEKLVDTCLKSNFKQVEVAKGLDHAFIFDRDKNQVALYCPESNIELLVSTTYPTAQIYSANYLTSREQYALCIETQYMPDSIHKEKNPKVILRANDHFHEETTYSFRRR